MSQKVIDLIKNHLVGKKVKHKNQYYREVVLEVEDVKVKKNHRQITPDTPQNDWWGESCDWDTITLHFVDGSSKEIQLETEIEIVE